MVLARPRGTSCGVRGRVRGPIRLLGLASLVLGAGCPRADLPEPIAGAAGEPRAAAAPASSSPRADQEAADRRAPRPSGWSTADRATGVLLRRACSTCHPFVPPAALTRAAWPRAVEDMYDHAGFGGGAAIGVPRAAALRWHAARAPERFPLARGGPVDEAARARFARRGLAPRDAPPLPAIAHVLFADFVGDARLELIACDMRHGYVLFARPYKDEPLRPLSKLAHPVHAEVVDLDGDGLRDLVVADLGAFDPGDHERGRVVWLRQRADAKLESIVLAEGLARPCDVRPLDADGDGDLDLVVACFGWRAKGGVWLLENLGPGASGLPRFAPRVLDARPGAVDVPVGDLLGEGRRGFVALLAQHVEETLWFGAPVTAAAGGAAPPPPRRLYAAPHAAWGSNGAALADLDGDGDLDVLLTNGDTLDDHLLKPYHGVRWLEQTSPGRFADRPLAPLYGVHDAQAADLDGDGDLDVIAAAFLPQVDAAVASDLALPSLVWLEQVAVRRFAPRVLERARPHHMTIAAADYDLDGDVDLAVGQTVLELRGAETGLRLEAWIELWEARR